MTLLSVDGMNVFETILLYACQLMAAVTAVVTMAITIVGIGQKVKEWRHVKRLIREARFLTSEDWALIRQFRNNARRKGTR